MGRWSTAHTSSRRDAFWKLSKSTRLQPKPADFTTSYDRSLIEIRRRSGAESLAAARRTGYRYDRVGRGGLVATLHNSWYVIVDRLEVFGPRVIG